MDRKETEENERRAGVVKTKAEVIKNRYRTPSTPPGNKKETVDHPAHYGGRENIYEHVKVMKAWGLVENAFLYQCTKYIVRAGKKSKETLVEDLEKAAWYLKRAIEYAKKNHGEIIS